MNGSLERLATGAVYALVVAGLAYRWKALDAGGAAATYLLALIIFGYGGWQWAIPIVTFFVLSSVLSRFGSARKDSLREIFDKGSTRDHVQVFANGGVAGVLVLLQILVPSMDWYPLYVGSIAAVTADTWATEIGVLAETPPRLITSLRTVQRGTSGGVTGKGFLGGAAGSIIIALSAFAWYDVHTMLFVAAAGILGSVADSLLGATVQARYRCPVCNALTEKRQHCNRQPTIPDGGIEWVTNDVVNWGCACMGAIVMAVFRTH